jgi:ubiquinone biosynthesis protein COQ4
MLMNATKNEPAMERRRAQRIRPLAAAMAIIRLMRNPQDTAQVFLLTEALRGHSTRINYEVFAASPGGAKILAERRSLLAALSDRPRLAALPEGTLGRCYADFMAEENLTAEGLVELAAQTIKPMPQVDEGLRLYAHRMRDMHDLYHVLTGYGRDELGEVCVLAFSYPQQKIRSFRVIAPLGLVSIWQSVRSARISTRGLRPALREAARNGQRAAWLPGEDLEGMLTENLHTLRARLNIPRPAIYNETISRLRRETGAPAGPLKEAVKARCQRAAPAQPGRV